MIREYLVQKKPSLQKAIQFTEQLSNEELRKWSEERAFIAHLDREPEPVIVIPTLEGSKRAYLGDYLLQGENGEIYPVSEKMVSKYYEFIRE